VSDRPDDFMINLTADGFNDLMAQRRAREAGREAKAAKLDEEKP
jgi:hypothetical protein